MLDTGFVASMLAMHVQWCTRIEPAPTVPGSPVDKVQVQPFLLAVELRKSSGGGGGGGGASPASLNEVRLQCTVLLKCHIVTEWQYPLYSAGSLHAHCQMFGPQSRILRSTDSIPEIVLPSQPGKDDSGGGGGGGGGVGIAAGGNAKTQATPSPATASTAVATAAAPAGTGSQSPSGISSLLSSRSTVPTAVHSSASVLGNKKQPPSSQQIRTNTTLVTESLGPKVERSVSASLIAPANRAKESGPVRSEQRHQGLRAGSVIARVTDQQFALPTAALSGTTHQPSLRDLAKPRPGATSTHGSTIAAMTNTTFTTTKTVPTQRHPQSHPPTITAGSHNTSKQPVRKTPLTLTSVSLPAQSTQAYSTVGATSAISHSRYK